MGGKAILGDNIDYKEEISVILCRNKLPQIISNTIITIALSICRVNFTFAKVQTILAFTCRKGTIKPQARKCSQKHKHTFAVIDKGGNHCRH